MILFVDAHCYHQIRDLLSEAGQEGRFGDAGYIDLAGIVLQTVATSPRMPRLPGDNTAYNEIVGDTPSSNLPSFCRLPEDH